MWIALMSLAFLVPGEADAQFLYKMTNGSLTITRYTGSGSVVVVPTTINGLPVTTIAERAFQGCASLTTVTIPDSITLFEPSLIDPYGAPVTFDSGDYFAGCTSLTNITVDPLNPKYSSLDGVVFDKELKALLIYPPGKKGPYEIPKGVEWICRGPFGDCPGLTSVTIPDTFYWIDGWTPYAEGPFGVHDVFLGCSGLTNITVDPFNPYWSSLDGVMFDKAQTNLFAYPAARPGAAYVVPATVHNIDPYAFAGDFGRKGGCANLTAVYFEGDRPYEAPSPDAQRYHFPPWVTVYYVPGNETWAVSNKYPWTLLPGGRPMRPWQPSLMSSRVGPEGQMHELGFQINWASGQSVVVETCSDLAHPAWTPVATNTISAGSAYFSDPQWTNHPGRFYRARPL